MTVIRKVSTCMLLLLASLILVQNISGDVEPNDTFQTSEPIYEGTYSGSVSDDEGSLDVDTYELSVEGFRDVDITAMKLSDGSGLITIEGYHVTGSAMGPDGILLHLTKTGEPGEDTWYNSGAEAETIYISVKGNGTYEMDILFSDRTHEEMSELMNICCLGTFGSFCGILVLIFLVFLLFFIFIFWFSARIMRSDGERRRRRVTRGTKRIKKVVKKKKKKAPALKACPHCGSELVFPKTPKYCPYCDRRISTEAPEPVGFMEEGRFY